MSILVAILVFSFLIIVHELGHFAAAKLLDVKVVEFSLFMGPRLLSFKKGETAYSLKLIPIGGSCMMEGEDTVSNDGRALNNRPRWARALIFAGGPLLNLISALILILILNLSTGYVSAELSAVGEGSAAATASVPLREGDRIVSYAGKGVGTPTDVFVYMQDTKGAPVDIGFVRDGTRMSASVTPVITPGRRYVLGFTAASSTGPDWNLVYQTEPGDPVDQLGIVPGDRILTLNGAVPGSLEEFRNLLTAAEGGEVEVVWRTADGLEKSGRVTPKLLDDPDSYSIGVAFTAVTSPGFFASVREAFYNSASMCKMVLYSLKWMVTGNVGLNQVSGPIGIVAEIGAGVEETSRAGLGIGPTLAYLANLTALIGINLGLFNLIPFPPLDGSKLLLLGVEAIRRKDIPLERQTMISLIGFGLLIVVMALTVFNDILRLVAK